MRGQTARHSSNDENPCRLTRTWEANPDFTKLRRVRKDSGSALQRYRTHGAFGGDPACHQNHASQCGALISCEAAWHLFEVPRHVPVDVQQSHIIPLSTQTIGIDLAIL